MKRLLAFATAAALVVGASSAEAQRVAPRFDLGLYGGWSWTSPWFNDPSDENFGIGSNPVFGVNTTFWTTPTFGVRFNGSYIPSPLPHAESSPASMSEDYPVNNYFLDLEGVFRPMWTGDFDLMSSLYFWLGGGVMFTNVAGDPATPAGTEYTCVPALVPEGSCLSFQPGYATVGQGTAGLGFDLVSLANNIGLFGEVGAHVYDSPTHSADDELDKYAVTPRGVVGLKFSVGSLAPPVVPVPPPPPPPPAPPAPAPPADRQIQVCVIQNGQAQNITATFRPATNDTVIGSQAFRTSHPATSPNYAAGANWFIQQDTMSFSDQTWVKFGVTRVIQPTQVQRVGAVNGTSVFAESGRQAPYDVVYVPVRPGCEFQPYQQREAIRPRG